MARFAFAYMYGGEAQFGISHHLRFVPGTGGSPDTYPTGPDNIFGYAGYVSIPVGIPTGRIIDGEFEYALLWLSRNRMYEPGTGRWLQQDPAGYVDGMSMYLYAGANPMGFVDPNGLACISLLSSLVSNAGTIAKSLFEEYVAGDAADGPDEMGRPRPVNGHAVQLAEIVQEVSSDPAVQDAVVEAGKSAAFAAVNFVPWVGDVKGGVEDVAMTVSPNSSILDRTVGGISIGINAATLGAAPNLGGPLRAGKSVVRASGEIGVGTRRALANRFEVGTYNSLRGRYNGALFNAHHVGQSSGMRRMVPGYNRATGPSILVDRIGHTKRGRSGGLINRNLSGLDTATKLVARDIWELRRVYPDVPNDRLRELIDLNRRMYPDAFK